MGDHHGACARCGRPAVWSRVMAGFCGDCGAPRVDGAKFCMECGRKFEPVGAPCPTCGQVMDDGPSAVSAAESPAAVVVSPLLPPETEDSSQGEVADPAQPPPSRGAYESSQGVVFFDGDGWYAARQLPGGVWIPDVAMPLPDFQAGDPSVVPVGPGQGPNAERAADRERGE